MADLIKYDPFSDAGFDDLFRGFFQPIRFEGQTQAPSIRMDVSEDDKSYIVHAEMPGVNKNDIQVTIAGNQVTLGAKVKRQKDVKEDQRVLRNVTTGAPIGASRFQPKSTRRRVMPSTTRVYSK